MAAEGKPWGNARELGSGAQHYVDVQTVQDHVDACFQASLAGIDLAKCRKLAAQARPTENVRPCVRGAVWVPHTWTETGRRGAQENRWSPPRVGRHNAPSVCVYALQSISRR